ncbi:hypothetical protein CBR_g29679 [Chara braunii]|uniref:Integrase catalytic domain-containing protein n=1 Tax=Chara braunii TaxID=69332 RepID=A0A388LBH1_CHABU|nr:hypothetical protein CBR_g29679 [Chara braunii]|eukprot:GBG79532.1 hypothetical protein CBR_g29679 [Chara braunii]
MPEEMADGGRKLLTLDDLIDALDKRERAPNNVPKVDTFNFKGERVSDWLDLVEQPLAGLADEVKFQRIMRYVFHSHHQEVGRVVDAANGSWARFRELMLRKYRLGDGLLTMADLEAMNKDDFSTIRAFVHEFKKKARKVHEISEETQCAIFLGLLTGTEAAELTSYGGGSEKLTWATIDKGVEEGSLDQVEQHQMRLQRRKRKERDATASGTPGVKRIVTDVLAALGYDNEAEVQNRGVTVAQGRASGAMDEEVGREDYGGEETGQFVAQLPPSQQASQASVAGGGNQGQGGQGNGGRGQGGQGGGGRGRGRNGGGRGGGWNGQGGQNQGGQEGGQGYGRPRFDWRSATCWHCGAVGPTIRFCQQRRDDELAGLISSCMNGDIYGKWGKHIDPKILGGIRQEALRRAAAGSPVTPTMFRMWQEREDPAIRVEEIVGDSEEVTQRLKAGAIREEPIVVDSDDERHEGERESAIVILEKMEDLLEKMGRYQWKLQALCEETREWKANLPEVFLYDSGLEPSSGQQGCLRVATVGTGPRSGMTYRPLTSHGRVPQAARTKNQNKARPSLQPSQAPSQAPPRKEPDPERQKEVVEVPEEEEEDDDEEDERLRQEEDRRTELRARKRGAQEEAEPSLPDSVPKRKKYAVRMEEGFDVERMVDRLLEGHNDLMNLKDILASTPRLRGELKGGLSRRLVPNVHLSTILPREVEWTEAGKMMDWKCMVCGQVDLVIKNRKCTGMVDTGVEMNIIREKEALMLGMKIDRLDHGMLHDANCKAAFCGTASNVIIKIGKVRARTCFFVMPDVDHSILLARSFLCRTEMLIFNKHDGTMILLLCDPACGNYEVITCRNTGPGSRRNRPNLGSFTFEELENERRTLWEVPEEEERAEVLPLSLTDVNKAVEVVSTQDMTNPEAIKALREQVLENPQVGEVELVNRLSGGRGGPAMALAQMASRPFLGDGLSRAPKGGTRQREPYLVGLMKKRHRSYAFNDDQRGRLDVDKIPMIRIHTVPHEPWNLRGARYPNPDEEKMVVDYLDGKMRTHVADYSSGPYASPWFCFIKPNGTLRWVQDLQRLNAVTVRDAGGLPNADALSESCVGRPVISLIDLYSGYDQFPVHDVKKTDKIVEWSGTLSLDNRRKELPWHVRVLEKLCFAAKTEHLRKLVRQDQEWVWGEDQEEAVGRMKTEFKEGGLVLGAPNYDVNEEKSFIIEMDAGPTALGGVLVQADAEGKERQLRFQSTHSLVEEVRTIEEGPTQVEEHEQLMGEMYLLTNTLLQGDFDQRSSFGHMGSGDFVPESQDDEFEEGEIKEALCAEEYDGIYLELGLLLSCEMRDKDASAKAQKMRHLYTKTGPVLANCIEEYYLRYPFVKEFVMDRGSEFTCNEVRTLLAGYGIVANYTTTAHPQANAPVERGYSTITNLLAKWTEGKPGQWPKFLRAAFFVKNITVKRTTKYAPATLWYGRHATFLIESFLKTWRRQDLEVNLSFEELLDIRARQVGAAEERLREAAGQVERNRMEDKMRWDQMARVRKEPLAVGDVVLLYDSSLDKQWSRKLDKRWMGPYKVLRCGEFGAYQIKELDGTGWQDWVSGTRLKKFVARE